MRHVDRKVTRLCPLCMGEFLVPVEHAHKRTKWFTWCWACLQTEL